VYGFSVLYRFFPKNEKRINIDSKSKGQLNVKQTVCHTHVLDSGTFEFDELGASVESVPVYRHWLRHTQDIQDLTLVQLNVTQRLVVDQCLLACASFALMLAQFGRLFCQI